MKRWLLKRLPDPVQATLFLRYFSLKKIPLIFYVRPKVVEMTQDTVVVKIPLLRRTKNHLNCMYIGAFAVGADLAAGISAMKLIRENRQPIALLFKSLHCEFFKRAEGDVHFTCNQGTEIRSLVNKAIETEERVEHPLEVIATVPDKLGEEPVARLTIVLSLKMKD